METTLHLYHCRFCAELKNAEGLLNFDGDDKKCSEICVKLTFMHAVFVNISNEDSLPKNICYDCYESLNQAYDFLCKVKDAQKVLSSLFLANNSAKHEYYSDDDRAALDDFFADNSEVSTFKIENECIKGDGETTLDIEVKIEPEDEELPSKIFQDAMKNINCGNDLNNSLNVQELLGVTEKTEDNEVLKVNKRTKTWKEYQWVCCICAIEFMDLESLRAHSKMVHNQCASFRCADCNEYTKSMDFKAFIAHVREHRPMLRTVCYYCDENVTKMTQKAHLKLHCGKFNLICPKCGEISETDELFKLHRKNYTVPKPTRKPRRKPGQPITLEDLTCHICKKIYKNPNSLRDHIKRHKIDRKKNYTCDRCGKTFFSKGTLTSHIQTHDSVRPHACKICNKSFQYPNMLRRHVQVHTGVKPFSCELCGRNFRLQYQLKSHKIVHTDAMPYSCKHCHKSFRFKQILRSHERLHTGAKPYSCSHCFMEFSNWSNYNKHMRRRHNVETAKKKITPEGVFPVNPETGQMVQIEQQGIEEWRRTVLIPGKRGRKKVNKSGTST